MKARTPMASFEPSDMAPIRLKRAPGALTFASFSF